MIQRGKGVALACQPVLQYKNPAVEGRGSLSSSFLSSGLAQGKGTENPPSHIRPRASCARGKMPPAFLGVMVGRIFLWVQIDVMIKVKVKLTG